MCGHQPQQQQQQGYGGYGYQYPQPPSGNYGYPPSGIGGGGMPQSGSRAPLMQQPNSAWNNSFAQPSMNSFAPMSMQGQMNAGLDINSFRQQAHFGNYGGNYGHPGAMAPTTLLDGQRHNPYGRQYPLPAHGGPPRIKDDVECAVIDNRKVCQDEECGGEEKGPQKKTKSVGGLDWVYGRPMLLLGSTAMGGYLMVVAILPGLTGMVSEASVYTLQCCAGVVTLTTTALILYGIFANPGEMTEREWEQCQKMKSLVKRDEESSNSDSEGDKDHPRVPLPARAHKSWQYPRPILRYDHYCKWLANVIGLRNHRQFFVMVFLLLCIGMYSIAVDAAVVYQAAATMVRQRKFEPEATWIIAACHLLYAMGMTYYVQGVFRIHFMLVLRNETAKDWRSNKNYRFELSAKGPDTTWSDLSEDEQEALFGTEVYRPELNAYDKGPANNCLAFWCTSRGPGQLGDF